MNRCSLGTRAWLALALVVTLLWPAALFAQEGDRASISVLRLHSELKDQEHADQVTKVLLELLSGVAKLDVVDRTDVMMGDLLLVHGCDNETPECLDQAADYFGTRQMLFGQVDPFGEDVLVVLRVYDAAKHDLRPVYSRKISEASLNEVLRADLADLISGALWELPGYLTLNANGLKDAMVSVDGAPVGPPPLDGWKVQPGSRVLRVRAPGYKDWEQTAEFTSGTPVELNVTLIPLKPIQTVVNGNGDGGDTGDDGETGTSEAPTVTHSDSPLAAWIVVTVAGLALTGAGVTGTMAWQKKTLFDDEDRQQPAQDLREEIETLAVATNVMLGVSGAALLTSGLMFAFLGESEPDDAVQVGAFTTGERSWIQLSLRF